MVTCSTTDHYLLHLFFPSLPACFSSLPPFPSLFLYLLQITMDILAEMTGDDLQSIGISTFGVRHRILKKIRELMQGSSNGGSALSLSLELC